MQCKNVKCVFCLLMSFQKLRHDLELLEVPVRDLTFSELQHMKVGAFLSDISSHKIVITLLVCFLIFLKAYEMLKNKYIAL